MSSLYASGGFSPREEGVSDDETYYTPALPRAHGLMLPPVHKRRFIDQSNNAMRRPEGRYPTPVSPSGRYGHETLRDRLKRQRVEMESPGSLYSGDEMVTRENILFNKGKRLAHCTGLPGKLYYRHDVVGPIFDSMVMMYYRMGWCTQPPMQDDVGMRMPRRVLSTDDHLEQLGYAPIAPRPPTPQILCKGCRTTNRHDFIPTADRSHMVCRCGVVSSAIHISTDREKNCAREDDKTTHADKPYEPKTDRFDHPAKSCDEMRREREREATGTRVSKKAKQKYGLGWAHEHNAREAARAERQRQEMDPKDQTKGQHIVIELEKLFTPLEPMDNQIKRFCRMEADRAWRNAVRHSALCPKGGCQLRIKEKGPAVIADAVLACSLETLLEGQLTLDGVTHHQLIVIADKRGALQSAKGTSSALRAVRTIVGTLLAHDGPNPVEPCPAPSCQASCQASPAPSSSPDATGQGGQPPMQHGGTPLMRAESSVSDLGEPAGELIQLRDSISKVFKALGTSMPNSVRESTLRAIQSPEFRAALGVAEAENDDVSSLTQHGLAYVLLEAVARAADAAAGTNTQNSRRVPPRILSEFATKPAQLDASADAVRALLPEGLIATSASEADGLFG